MAKRFKFGISRVFQSCRSKDETLPSNNNQIPSFLPLPLTTPKPHHHRSSLRRHVSSAFIPVGCGFRSGSTPSLHRHNQPHHDFHWEQQDKWHVVAKLYPADSATTPRRKIYNSSASADDDVFPLPLPPPRVTCDRKKKRRLRKKKTTALRFRMSTSSADSCGLFSSDVDEEETETLVSTSRSFSTECSSLESTKKMRKPKKKKTKKKRGGGGGSISMSPESISAARLSMLLRVMPWKVEGKVRESFAVVKRSEDPYEDFRRLSLRFGTLCSLPLL
ncbi:transcription repressor OFP7 [Senna tora]|uniref:Transcription repressor OFP7 n=1 Tax=Senna tora TaxID=362788 RepID=A0A834TV83_9FABA|nr:transcription repressor OFP7 [Senna tora]